jgi:hypothetical protein
MLVVQGWRTDNYGIDVPAGEEVVRLPALLAVDAVAALDGENMTFVDLTRMLRTFATSAFRLETRQLYTTDAEAGVFAAWRADGRIPDADDPLIAGWTQIIRAHTESSAQMRRVHVVSQPLTEYLRFELALQRIYSVPAGEQFRVVDAAAYPDLAAADDFWLLDNRVEVRLIYDDAGRLTRLRRMTTSEVDVARSVFDATWAAGTDLTEFEPMAIA